MVGIAQLEIIGVDKLIKERLSEIESVLEEIKVEESCDYTFVNAKDLETGVSQIICLDEKTKKMLQDALNTEWIDNVGTSKDFTLRKQIAAWVDEKLS